jgi:hypothetical protein
MENDEGTGILCAGVMNCICERRENFMSALMYASAIPDENGYLTGINGMRI